MESSGKSTTEYGRRRRKAYRVGIITQSPIMIHASFKTSARMIHHRLLLAALSLFTCASLSTAQDQFDASFDAWNLAPGVDQHYLETAEHGPVFQMKLMFGNRKRECSGFGICHFFLTFVAGEDFDPLTNPGANGSGWINERQRLMVRFDKGQVNPGVASAYLNGTFQVEEAFTIGDGALKPYGGPENYTIPAGRYPITDDGKTLTIAF